MMNTGTFSADATGVSPPRPHETTSTRREGEREFERQSTWWANDTKKPRPKPGLFVLQLLKN
jgi:hypothetical protein